MNYRCVLPFAANTVANDKNKGILIIGGSTSANDITIVCGGATGLTYPVTLNIPSKYPLIWNVHTVSWSGINIGGVFLLY